MSVNCNCQHLQNEVDHLQNTLLGLNEKLIVFNDLKRDLATHKQMLQESETKRQQLQDKLTAKAAEMDVLQQDFIRNQSGLAEAIAQLTIDRNALDTQLFNIRKDHLQVVTGLNSEHIQRREEGFKIISDMKLEFQQQITKYNLV